MSESDDRIPRVVRRSPLISRVRLCPRCLTPLQVETSPLSFLAPQNYYCPKCGYSGTVHVESERNVETTRDPSV